MWGPELLSYPLTISVILSRSLTSTFLIYNDIRGCADEMRNKSTPRLGSSAERSKRVKDMVNSPFHGRRFTRKWTECPKSVDRTMKYVGQERPAGYTEKNLVPRRNYGQALKLPVWCFHL